MAATPQQAPPVKLSICITTFNRAAFIGATLDSILPQLTEECEIVILDGASTDGTERAIAPYVHGCERLRYIKQDCNNGFDRDCDRVVELARGEYCWVMTDDDLLKPDAVATILAAARRDFSLIVLNVEFRNFDMSKILQRRWLRFPADREYERTEMDRLFADVDEVFMYVGSFVFKREMWLARDRARYYDSLFIYVGVILQEQLPGNALVIARPLISYRMGNTHTFSSQVREIMLVKWPTLIGSLAVSESARRQVRSAQPWRNPRWLLRLRGWGLYSRVEYRRWVRPHLRSTTETLIPTLVALLPGVLVNTALVFYYSIRGDQGRWLQLMRRSPCNLRNRRLFRRSSSLT
jgi:abequosyltransferase